MSTKWTAECAASIEADESAEHPTISATQQCTIMSTECAAKSATIVETDESAYQRANDAA